jgi:hypothetical protein
MKNKKKRISKAQAEAIEATKRIERAIKRKRQEERRENEKGLRALQAAERRRQRECLTHKHAHLDGMTHLVLIEQDAPKRFRYLLCQQCQARIKESNPNFKSLLKTIDKRPEWLKKVFTFQPENSATDEAYELPLIEVKKLANEQLEVKYNLPLYSRV